MLKGQEEHLGSGPEKETLWNLVTGSLKGGGKEVAHGPSVHKARVPYTVHVPISFL